MIVTVSFRGPMLVVANDTTIDSIRIPDSRKRNAIVDAQPHTAGYIRVDKNGKEVDRAEITGPVTIATDGGGACQKHPSVNGLACLQDLIDGGSHERLVLVDLANDPEKRLISVVTFAGGTLSTRRGSAHVYRFPKVFSPKAPRPAPLPLITDWMAETKSVTMTVNGTAIPLADGDHIYIVNIESFSIPNKTPAPSKLETGQSDPGMGEWEDADFRWAYWCTNPATQTFAVWLKSGEQLPTPCFSSKPTEIPGQAKGVAGGGSDVTINFDPDSGDCIHLLFDTTK